MQQCTKYDIRCQIDLASIVLKPGVESFQQLIDRKLKIKVKVKSLMFLFQNFRYFYHISRNQVPLSELKFVSKFELNLITFRAVFFCTENRSYSFPFRSYPVISFSNFDMNFN